MPLSELRKKWWGMSFEIAAEEMRRLYKTPTNDEKLRLYGLYKQAIHGDIPSVEEYGRSSVSCKEEYVGVAEEMIKKYERNIVRSKWNADVWSVDY